jgi:hypothetical protein
MLYTATSGTMKHMAIEDRVLIEIHRAAIDAARRGIAVPSVDLVCGRSCLGSGRWGRPDRGGRSDTPSGERPAGDAGASKSPS